MIGTHYLSSENILHAIVQNQLSEEGVLAWTLHLTEELDQSKEQSTNILPWSKNLYFMLFGIIVTWYVCNVIK